MLESIFFNEVVSCLHNNQQVGLNCVVLKKQKNIYKFGELFWTIIISRIVDQND